MEDQKIDFLVTDDILISLLAFVALSDEDQEKILKVMSRGENN